MIDPCVSAVSARPQVKQASALSSFERLAGGTDHRELGELAPARVSWGVSCTTPDVPFLRPFPSPGRERARRSAGPASRILPFEASENARQRPQGHRRADRLPEHRVAADPGADRLAQRGRARQVGLRPLLRAHDVPRHARPTRPRSTRTIITKAGARQNAYTTDDLTNYHTTFAKEDLETILEVEADRFQNLTYGERPFKTEARAVLGEYNKNSANPVQQADRGAARRTPSPTHTYKHTTMGFLKDIEDMPNQFEYSKVFFDRWYRPEYTDASSSPATSSPKKVLAAGREVLGRLEARQLQGRRARRSRRRRAPSTRTCRGRRPTLPWVTRRLPRARRSRTRTRTWRRCDAAARLSLRPHLALYKRLVRGRAEGGPARSYFAAEPSDPVPGHGRARASKKPEDALVRARRRS